MEFSSQNLSDITQIKNNYSHVENGIHVRNYKISNNKVELTVDYDELSKFKKNKSCSESVSLSNTKKINIVKINDEQQTKNSTYPIDYLIKNKQTENMVQTEITLDSTTQSQLTPKFIKSTSNSEWANFDKELSTIYSENEPTKFDFDKATEIAEHFAHGLEADSEKFNQGLEISDIGLFAPRARSTYNNESRPFRFVNEVVKIMFIDTGKTSELLNGKVMYTKLISKLSKHYVSVYTKQFLINNKFKLFRLLEHNKDNWIALKNKPISTVISEPVAMPVEIAPIEELEPFFKFLNSNMVPIDNDDEYEPCMRFIRGAIYQDKRMDLCKQVVGHKWIQMLMNSLVNNTNVEHFLLGNNIIGPEGGKAIGNFLLNPHKPNIKTWYLAGNALDEEAISYIVNGLENDSDCESLWLKRNPLKPEGIFHIGRLLKTNTHIKILDLHNTAVFDTGVKYLVEGLKLNRTLRHLYLDANAITKIGCKYICEYFEYLIENDLEGISSFWIDMNTLEDDAVIELVQILGKYKYLKRLCLGSTGITEKSAKPIVDAFIHHSNLIMLDLGMYKSTGDMGMITNNIGDEGMKILSELVEKSTSIQYFSVMMNGMTESGIEYLADALDKSTTLMYVDFAQYGVEISQKLSSRIRNKIQSNRTNANFTRKQRNVKHGEQIHWIDSIYRNNMKN